MKIIDKNSLDALLAVSHVRPRLRRELKYNPQDIDWDTLDFLVVTTAAQDKGVLIVPNDAGYYVAEFDGRRRPKATGNGRIKAAICDICYTWRAGGGVTTITFPLNKGERSVGVMACLDLQCSHHVRGLTNAARVSRAQLPENLTVEQRVDRLNSRLHDLLERISAEYIQFDP